MKGRWGREGATAKRESLAAIQATHPAAAMTQDELLALLNARVKAAVAQLDDDTALRSVIRSGLPLRAAQVLRARSVDITAAVKKFEASAKEATDLAEVVTAIGVAKDNELSARLLNTIA